MLRVVQEPALGHWQMQHWTQALLVLVLCTQFSSLVWSVCAACPGLVLPAWAGKKAWCWSGLNCELVTCFVSVRWHVASSASEEMSLAISHKHKWKERYSVYLKERTVRSTDPKLCFKSFGRVGVLESGKGNSSRFSISFFFSMLYHNLLLLRSKKGLCKWPELFLVKTIKIPCNLSSVPLIGMAWAWSLWNSVELHLHQKQFWFKMHSDLCLRCLATW